MPKLKTEITINLNETINLTEQQARARYNIGRNSLFKISDEAGAVVRIGKKRLYSRRVLDEYFATNVE